MFDTSEIVAKANRIVEECSTRDPHKIARELGIEVMPYAFQKQKGAYKVAEYLCYCKGLCFVFMGKLAHRINLK